MPVTTRREGAVSLLTLNDPQRLNALSPQMLSDLCAALERESADPQVRVLVITGAGRAFAAGADIQAMSQASPTDMLRMNTRQYWQRIAALEKPLIAAVNGYAYGGGCELALTCDLIVASERARFAQPEINLGIMPGGGGTQRLARLIGPYRAAELVLTGEPISAERAFRWGLVNRLVPPERLLPEALELAARIAAQPPMAVRLARQALRQGYETTLRDGMEIERRNFLLLFDTPDQAEGMRAFLEKRPPKWKGDHRRQTIDNG